MIEQTLIAELHSRMDNWKFASANGVLNKILETKAHVPADLVAAIRSLSSMFANIGWQDGDMSMLISIAVQWCQQQINGLDSGSEETR